MQASWAQDRTWTAVAQWQQPLVTCLDNPKTSLVGHDEASDGVFPLNIHL